LHVEHLLFLLLISLGTCGLLIVQTKPMAIAMSAAKGSSSQLLAFAFGFQTEAIASGPIYCDCFSIILWPLGLMSLKAFAS